MGWVWDQNNCRGKEYPTCSLYCCSVRFWPFLYWDWFYPSHGCGSFTALMHTVWESRGRVPKLFSKFCEGGWKFWGVGTPFWCFSGFLLTSFAKKLEKGYTFIPPHPFVCIYASQVWVRTGLWVQGLDVPIILMSPTVRFWHSKFWLTQLMLPH